MSTVLPLTTPGHTLYWPQAAGREHRFIRQLTGQMNLTLVTSRVVVETVRLAVEGLVMWPGRQMKQKSISGADTMVPSTPSIPLMHSFGWVET